MIARFVLLILTAAALTGCGVGKKDPRRDHREQSATTQDNPPTPEDKKTGYYGLDLTRMHQLSKEATGRKRVQEIVLPLAAVVLKEENMMSGEFKGHSQTTWALEFLNSQLTLALKESPADADLKALKASYRERMLQGCEFSAMNGCRHLRFLSRDPQLGALIKLFAIETADVEQYYRLLKLVYEFQGDVADRELEKLVFARMAEVLKLFLNVTNVNGATRMSLKPLNGKQQNDFAQYNSSSPWPCARAWAPSSTAGSRWNSCSGCRRISSRPPSAATSPS